ncbi:MAG: Xaa-Pro peptidase family protein [Pseudomonadota bacterium]
MFEERMKTFRTALYEASIDVALVTDDDNVCYLAGYHDYLHMDFGRPAILIVLRGGESVLLTPVIDHNTARATARVDRIVPWNDGDSAEWRACLPRALASASQVAIEPDHMPSLVRDYVGQLVDPKQLTGVTPILSQMRRIKSPEELQLDRHAGQVAMAMMEGSRAAMAPGVPESEVALAASAAGTRKAAALLEMHYAPTDMSPNTQFSQIMASGEAVTKTRHRASTRIMRHGEPVFMWFCGMTNFHRFKLGFDRTFWLGEIVDPTQAALYEVAVASQAAALAELRPGVTAETVQPAYAEVIQSAGYAYPFRCGRATGFSYLEHPQLVSGDKTVLQPGMVLAVDGSVTGETFRAQVGDSVIVTGTGYELLTHHPKAWEEMLL